MVPNEAAQRFAFALSGIWLSRNDGSFKHFGGRPAGPANRRWARGLLSKSWGISDADKLHERLVWLRDQGHTAELAATTKEWQALPPDQREQTLQLIFVGKFGREVGDAGLVAWDHGRLINVAGWGFLAGMLTEEEAWSYILPAAQKIQRTYDSWQSYGRAYLLGVAYWGPGHLETNQPAFESLIADSTGPWNTIPWSTPLGGSAASDAAGGGGALGALLKIAGALVAVAVLVAVCAGVGVVGVGASMLVIARAPSAPISDWNGVDPFTCKGNEKRTIANVSVLFAEGAAITAVGNCTLTIHDAVIGAPIALKASANATITVHGGHLAGGESAIDASGNAKITMVGTVVEGRISSTKNVKITGP